MNRILFEKTGRAIYLSHLDTMALFPRVFQRAGLRVKFTQGMSPHAYVSIALPLSVGTSSRCELLDFTLEEDVPLESLAARLNPFFPEGIRVREAYDSPRKIKELKYLLCRVTLEYDAGTPDGARDAVAALFQRKSLSVEKKSKKGMTETDIRPMISTMAVSQPSPQELELGALICAQNPALNPGLLVSAIGRYLPELTPDFSRAHRLEVFDENGQIFR